LPASKLISSSQRAELTVPFVPRWTTTVSGIVPRAASALTISTPSENWRPTLASMAMPGNCRDNALDAPSITESPTPRTSVPGMIATGGGSAGVTFGGTGGVVPVRATTAADSVNAAATAPGDTPPVSWLAQPVTTVCDG
jgi:hypothetical protein